MSEYRHTSRTCLTVAGAVATAMLAACTGLTGLGGSDQYGCKAPAGVKCESVSGTYHNALQNNLPSQRPRQPSGAAHSPLPASTRSASRDEAPTASAAAVAASAAGDAGAADRSNRSRPLRSEARVLRLWIKAYEDSDHDLHEQGFVYVQVESGRWLVDHAQRQAREAYAPIKPPRTSTSTGGTPGSERSSGAQPGAVSSGDASWSAARAIQAPRGAQPLVPEDGTR